MFIFNLFYDLNFQRLKTLQIMCVEIQKYFLNIKTKILDFLKL